MRKMVCSVFFLKLKKNYREWCLNETHVCKPCRILFYKV